MKLSVCTISFRHQLISVQQIAHWAQRNQFQGIELWGVHASNLGTQADCNYEWLRSLGLYISMISDYLPLNGNKKIALAKTEHLCQLAQVWRTKKLRTFAGDKGSDCISIEERKVWVSRLRELCEVAESFGTFVVVETHPNTLADTLLSTQQLLEEVDHRALRINFDVIHLWEAGCDPVQAFQLLEPFIVHMHLKNVSARELLHVFAPANVYAPAGKRVGMVSLFEGAFDFKGFLSFVMTQAQSCWNELDASLEWFGPDVMNTLAHDRREIACLSKASHWHGRQLEDARCVENFVGG